MLKCFKCDKQSPLFRQNEKGVEGIWACKEHNTQPIDILVEELTEIIEQDNKK